VETFLATCTGLRRGEINALRWGDLHLDVTNPFYAVPVAKSKSRKEQPRPLHHELVRELQAMKSAGKFTPETLIFPDRVPAMKVIRTDFKTAGIPLEVERGHRVDFHALRMTYITRLQRASVVTPRWSWPSRHPITGSRRC
jgi:integrase